MVVECGSNMAASNSLSTVPGRSSSSDGSASGQNGNHAMLPFQSVAREDDTVRINGNNCEDNQQFRAEFLSASRRKRVNRSAKLKQYKLDARREQWLSQGSPGKQGKAEQEQLSVEPHQWNCEHPYKAEAGECMMAQERTGSSGHSRSQGSTSSGSLSERTPVGSPATYHRFSGSGTSNDVKIANKEAPGGRRQAVVSSRAPRYFRDEEELHGRQDLATHGRSSSDASKPRSSSSCASSSCTGSDSEDNDESTHDAADDWESAFDALHVRQAEGSHKGLSSDRALHSDARELHDKKQNGAHHHHHHHHHQRYHHHHPPDAQIAQLKPEYRYRNSGFGGRRGNGGRAWRSDDVSRPPTLPRLRVQHAYSNHSNNNNNNNNNNHHNQGWGNIHGNMWENQQPASPSYCPICTEELDMTDSSYLPCTCGFQLCLFCYHRISSDDGRCPGCRKAYDADLAVQLSRSSSVWVRV